MELGGGPQKMDEHSPGFHGLSRLVSKNIASDVPRNDQCLFILYSKNEFFKLISGYPTTGAVEQWKKPKKPTLQWKPMELGGVPI